jgi:hypothetical protein
MARKARDRVFDLRVGEAFGDLDAIGFQADAGRWRRDGQGFALGQRLEEGRADEIVLVRPQYGPMKCAAEGPGRHKSTPIWGEAARPIAAADIAIDTAWSMRFDLGPCLRQKAR